MPASTNLKFLWRLLEEEAEVVEQEEEMQRTAALAVALMLAGAEEDRRNRIDRRNDHRGFLTRPDLLPDPRGETPWQKLLAGRSDHAYIVTMGFDVKAFELILSSGFEERWNSATITRTDVASTGAPRPHRRSLDAAGGLGLIFHYLSSTMTEVSLQQIFALVPSTVTRYITFSLEILLQTLCRMPEGAIRWLKDHSEFRECSDLVEERHHLLRGAFATIDGLNLPCQTSDDIEIENATFNGWLHEHFISSVIVFDPKGEHTNCLSAGTHRHLVGAIRACHFNCPGSWHDSRVAKPIYEKLRTETPDGFYLVADTAFPRGTDQIIGRIRAPIKAGEVLPYSGEELEAVLAYDRALLSYRQSAEWGMRALQGAFGRLRVPLVIAHSSLRADILETCFRLHQVRTRVVGINQILNVYVRIWREGNQAEVWDGFEDMLFSEQIQRDRVSSFHIVPTYDN